MYERVVRESSIYAKGSYHNEHEDFIMRNGRQLAAKATLKNEIDVYAPPRKYSMVQHPEELAKVAQDILRERNRDRKLSFIQKFMANRKYFLRLFPLLKEQKPGIDLYFPITLSQFVLIFYTIIFYP
mmetsp:Transcript_33904/g.33002  ORF Transcript_33904/g.33002 Transcript_33904/m.33002 type:complete len:127 (+) Transcript_33904:898-1278(+)